MYLFCFRIIPTDVMTLFSFRRTLKKIARVVLRELPFPSHEQLQQFIIDNPKHRIPAISTDSEFIMCLGGYVPVFFCFLFSFLLYFSSITYFRALSKLRSQRVHSQREKIGLYLDLVPFQLGRKSSDSITTWVSFAFFLSPLCPCCSSLAVCNRPRNLAPKPLLKK